MAITRVKKFYGADDNVYEVLGNRNSKPGYTAVRQVDAQDNQVGGSEALPVRERRGATALAPRLVLLLIRQSLALAASVAGNKKGGTMIII